MKKLVCLILLSLVATFALKAEQKTEVELEFLMQDTVLDKLNVTPCTPAFRYASDTFNYVIPTYKYNDSVANIFVGRSTTPDYTFDSIVINGIKVVDNTTGTTRDTGSLDVKINPGDTICKIELKGRKNPGDILCVTNYTLKFHRQSNDCGLGSLTLQKYVGAGTPSSLLFRPLVNKDSLLYITDTVDADVASIEIDAKTSHDSASIVSGNGKFPLNNFGWNTFEILIQAEDDLFTQTYIVKTYRRSNDTTLKKIELSSGYLSPAFDPKKSDYLLVLDSRPDDITIKGILNNLNASVVGNTTIPLDLGEDMVTLTVTAEDTRYTKNYRITIKLSYDTVELDRFKNFLRQGTNADVLGVDLNNPDPDKNWIFDSTGIKFGVSNNKIKVERLEWAEKQLSGEVDFSNFEILTYFNCYEVPFTQLNLSDCKRLGEVRAYKSNLYNVNVLGCDKLYLLRISYNHISNLDVSGLSNLIELECQTNGMNTLNLSGCSSLKYLSCYSNNLETLQVEPDNLEKIWCMENKLKFSTLPSVFINIYSYSPQKDIVFNNMLTTSTVDLSSEYIAHGVPTSYSWYYIDNNAPIEDGITNNEGVFSFDNSFEGKGIYCLMGNSLFPDLQLKANVYFYEYTGVNKKPEKQNTASVKLYPNPAKEFVNFQVENYTGQLGVTIFDIKGKLVKTEKIKYDKEAQQLQLGNLPSGTYVVRLTSKTFSEVKSLIVK